MKRRPDRTNGKPGFLSRLPNWIRLASFCPSFLIYRPFWHTVNLFRQHTKRAMYTCHCIRLADSISSGAETKEGPVLFLGRWIL